jgi:hypothetical protein
MVNRDIVSILPDFQRNQAPQEFARRKIGTPIIMERNSRLLSYPHQYLPFLRANYAISGST